MGKPWVGFASARLIGGIWGRGRREGVSLRGSFKLQGHRWSERNGPVYVYMTVADEWLLLLLVLLLLLLVLLLVLVLLVLVWVLLMLLLLLVKENTVVMLALSLMLRLLDVFLLLKQMARGERGRENSLLGRWMAQVIDGT
jgi:hypothetical protein